MAKTYVIRSTRHRNGSSFTMEGTVAELVGKTAYTLECGASWQHEKGNKKINQNPKTINSLISNLNNAVNNSAANGCADTFYELVN